MVFNRGEVGSEATNIGIVDGKRNRSTISYMVWGGAITSGWCIHPCTSIGVIQGPGDS